MSQRDYNNYGRKTTRKNQKKKSNRKPLMLMLILVIVLCFVAFLYFLTTKQPKENQIQTSQPTNNIAQQEIRLPTKQEETWTYIKELENREINKTYKDSDLTPEQKKVLNELTKDKNMPRGHNLDEIINQIQTDAPKNDPKVVQAKPVVTNHAFALQCGAFSKRNSAESLQGELILNGYDAQIIKSKDNMHRIIVGPFAIVADAEYALKQLRPVTPCIVIKYK